jgi:hypothetical protein
LAFRDFGAALDIAIIGLIVVAAIQLAT